MATKLYTMIDHQLTRRLFFLVICSLFLLITGVFSSFTFPVMVHDNPAPGPTPGWVKKAGARRRPQQKKIFKVNDYGATADGKTVNTSSIQKAIDACATAGGGIVVFDTGRYVTGSIFVKSNVTLRIDQGVTLLGSQNISDYRVIPTRIAGIEMKWPAALINVVGQKNVAITGSGVVDGRGKPFWDKYWAMRKVYDVKGIRWAADYDCRRPRLLLISGSQDVTLQGIHLQRSGFWTVHILYSGHVTVEGITIQNNIGGHGPSTDGVDIDSSTFILVENCDIDCNDDDYCLKAGRDADGLRVNKPTEYVVIRHCIARSGGGLITCGSETSGGIRHVLVEDSKAIGTGNGVNFKSAFTRGGTVEDIHIERITMTRVKTAITLNLNWNPSYSYTTLPPGFNKDSIPRYWKVMLEKVPPSRGTPTIRNVYISDVTATDCRTAIHAVGMKTSPLKNFGLSHIDLSAKTAGRIQYAEHWRFNQVRIHTTDGSKIAVTDSKDVKY
jgi:polygalacturonase